ncbi:MAG: hypothetical protein JST51_03210 [Armatimonadetes bacterium]|nr:hypothetical protein [Armatimonadota bacterium]
MMQVKGLVTFVFLALVSLATADQSIYSEQLNNSWQNWSWANVNFSNATPVHGGTKSISVTATGPNQALYLHHNAQWTTGYQSLTFWIHGGTSGGQLLQVQASVNGDILPAYPLPALTANTWTKVVVPLVGIGVHGVNSFDGFWIQDRSGTTQGTYYVDDVSLVDGPGSTASLPAFDDALLNSWQNWSWATVNLGNTSPTHGGTKSISVHENAAYEGFYLHHAALDSSLYRTISFWINGGASGGQQLQVMATANGSPGVGFSLPALPANKWVQYVIPLSKLGIPARGDFDGFWIQGRTNSVNATYYVDDLSLNVEPVVNAPAMISIDAGIKYRISPYIYGANTTDYAGLGTGFRFARSGGNRLTAYNWENNASNAGSDWYFQNDGYLGSTDEAGWTDRTFIQAAIAGGAIPLVTIPTVGHVSADKWGDGDVRNYPDYLNTRFKVSKAAKPGSNFVYPPDTTDGYVYQDECVHYLMQFAKPSFPIMFDLDNEPDLWSSTHNEVHPTPATYAEMIALSTEYASAIKNVYPSATIFGPVNYGWYGFMALQGASDGGGRNFLDVYLDGMRNAEVQDGKRLLDVLDVHWYPEAQGDGHRIVSDGDTPGMSEARIQSPRSLWDSSYVETSWITQSMGNAPIRLIPMIQDRIHAHYPGTKLGFTEYSYGGANAISGAIAQADVLGLMGRNGVFAAANWYLNSSSLATLAGFRSFINYDGAGAHFGDLGAFVSGETAAENSVYASVTAERNPDMVIVVINKTEGVTPFVLSIAGFRPKTGTAYTVTDGHFLSPTTSAVKAVGQVVKFDAPPQSVTTIVLPKS